MRHILRSSSNTPTSPSAGPQDSRLPPSGRGAVHAMANKMSATTSSDVTSPPPGSEKNEFSGLISRAKDGLSSSSSSSSRSTFHKTDVQEHQPVTSAAPRVPEKSETQIKWEEIEKNLSRSLKVTTSSSSSSPFERWK